MAKCFFNKKAIEDYGQPYIVAEVNSSHNGNIDVAKEMIDVAKACDCDCVKFQSWSAKTLYSNTYYKINPMAKRFVDKFSLSKEKLKELALYCKKVGIDFSSTPYSEQEVDFLADECDVAFIKISSMELNNPSYLKYIGEKGCPIILSTGMGENSEIEQAVKVLEATGNRNIVLLHCVSIYPADATTINLNNIIGLRKNFPNYAIGFSDHTKGDEAAIAAIALGACVIEKHFTLDSSKIGMDNQMAIEPEQLKGLVKKCRIVQKALGSFERILTEEEYKQRLKMRRSLVVTHDMKVGDIVTFNDLCAKRPGTGIPPNNIDKIIGKKLVKNIECDNIIFDDFLE